MAIRDTMCIIVGNDLDSRTRDMLRQQLAADVLTSDELAEQERLLAEQQNLEQQAQNNTTDMGDVPDEGSDGFSAPDDANVDEAAQVGEEKVDEGNNTEGEQQPEDNKQEESEAEEPNDDLKDPEVALEHARASGPAGYGYYLKNGLKKYKQFVRKNRLAQETIQMEIARNESLIKRLLYVKPSDTGFTSKLQTMIATIEDPTRWIAYINQEGISTADQELVKRKIYAALEKAGIQVFDNFDNLVDSINEMQKAIVEPSV